MFDSQEEAGLDSNIVSAVNAVADALGSEQKTIRSDLLKKLQEHSDRTDLPKTDSVRYCIFQLIKVFYLKQKLFLTW